MVPLGVVSTSPAPVSLTEKPLMMTLYLLSEAIFNTAAPTGWFQVNVLVKTWVSVAGFWAGLVTQIHMAPGMPTVAGFQDAEAGVTSTAGVVVPSTVLVMSL